MIKKIFKLVFNKNFLPLFIIFILALLAARTLVFQHGYFQMHDDLQMMRQLEIEKCFLDGQIPCRWAPDMGFGYGFPLFNFYPPLPYLIGEVYRVMGLSFITTAKLLFATSIVVSGITMYFLAKEFFGTLGALVSSAFYIWAPYHAVDIYVRGAMNEAWALSFFPLVFLSSYKLIAVKDKNKWLVVLTLAYTALLTSHNLMVLIFTPFFLMWVMLFMWQKKAWYTLYKFFVSGIWSLGLSAFITIPALLENHLTHIRSQLMGYFEYVAHFATIKQLLVSRFWGYGGSAWGIENDKMSFQIGWVHWMLSIIVLFALLTFIFTDRKNLAKNLKKNKIILPTLFMVGVGWFSAFMTHSRSTFIYKVIPQFGYVQFPWRFLTIVIFAFSFVAGFIPGFIAKWKSKKGMFLKVASVPFELIIAFVLMLLVVGYSWQYFFPKGGRMGPLTDKEKFTGAAWELQQGGGVHDYLPINAKIAPTQSRDKLAEVVSGKASLSDPKSGTYWAKFRAEVSDEQASVRINIYDFPEWKVFSENGQLDIYVPQEEKLGRMWIDLQKGDHIIYAQLYNTPVRSLSNIISLFSWVVMILIVVDSFGARGKIASLLRLKG